jgi:RHS repeat-associated protein
LVGIFYDTDGGTDLRFNTFHDYLGSVRQIVTDAANPVDDSRFDYTAYGLNDTEKDYSGLPFDAASPTKFAGAWAYYDGSGRSSDQGGGAMILCGERWYDPLTGRWLTEDPVGFAGGVNLYGYCGNRPTCIVDPSGLDYSEYDPFVVYLTGSTTGVGTGLATSAGAGALPGGAAAIITLIVDYGVWAHTHLGHGDILTWSDPGKTGLPDIAVPGPPDPSVLPIAPRKPGDPPAKPPDWPLPDGFHWEPFEPGGPGTGGIWTPAPGPPPETVLEPQPKRPKKPKRPVAPTPVKKKREQDKPVYGLGPSGRTPLDYYMERTCEQ